ncbi:MAG: efflux RND transporter periplasmic adaptor subunit [Candidatus Riflemargulisbacteria bacterium]
MLNKYGIIVILLLVIVLLLIPKNEVEYKKILFYRNPMDPSITSPVPKKDEMGMDYEPVFAEGKATENPKEGISLSDSNADLLSIKTIIVKLVHMNASITAAGSVAYDPELYVAQEEYIQALKSISNQPNNQDSNQILRASKQKLLLAGMTTEQIDSLARNGNPDKNLYQPIKNGSVWVYFSVFEKDSSLIHIGQTVQIDAVGLPGKTFSAVVRGIPPVLDSDTRSLKVRAEVLNSAGQLKPGMYITATVLSKGDTVLAIPEDAVIDTGIRTIVYVESEKGQFVARPIQSGRRFNGQIEILSGLTIGEKIVAEGNFFIDSESKLQGM